MSLTLGDPTADPCQPPGICFVSLPCMRPIAALTACALLLVLPGVALAASTPPGNSAVDQYLEALPAPGGNQPTSSGGSRDPRQTLGGRNIRELEALGPDGTAAAQLAADTAPSQGGPGKPSGTKERAGTEPQSPAQSGGSASSDRDGGFRLPLGDLAEQPGGDTDSGGMGIVLPVILGASLALALLALIRRRRLTI